MIYTQCMYYVAHGGNPPGYGSPHLASVGRLFVDVDMGGLVKSLGHRQVGHALCMMI